MSAPTQKSRILIRDSRGRRFLAADGWTRDQSKARDFFNPIAAYRFVVENALQNVQLVLLFTAGIYEGRSAFLIPA
jgi:hypothetical protein